MLQMQRTWVTLIIVIIIVELFDQLLFSKHSNNHLGFSIAHMLLNTIPVITLMILLIYVRKQTKELNQSHQRLNSIFDFLDVAIWSHDLRTNTLMITPGIEKLYGYSLNEFYDDHDLWRKVVHPLDVPVLEERGEKLKEQKSVTSIYRIFHKDGDLRWIQDSGIPSFDERGNFIDFTSVLFDVTDQKEGEDQYRGLVEMSPDFIAVIRDWTFIYLNESGSRLLGYEGVEDLIGKRIRPFVAAEYLGEIQEHLIELDKNKNDHQHFEIKVVKADGGKLDLEMSVMTIVYKGKEARMVIGRDITERKKADETIQYMAYYDALTGLPNRNMFKEHVDKRLNENPEEKLAVLFLDLDRFKVINDTKGHSIGDRLLQLVARRLTDVVKESGVVSRQGGDEFLLLLENTSTEAIEHTANQLIKSFAKPFTIMDEDFFVTTSIGISVYPMDGEEQETLIKHADTAMYLAKDQGKNNFQFFNPSLNKLTTRKMKLEAELRKAIKLDELSVYYQPQYDMQSEKITAVEALLRWHHPQFGMVSPGEFIPLAEETGLIIPIGEWVIERVLMDQKKWKAQGISYPRVAVNVSVRQLQERSFVRSVENKFNQYQGDSCLLELEITESIMQNVEESIRVLSELKELGVTISIDDFGKGYSSLSYLKHLPIDKIKIDKSFVDDIGGLCDRNPSSIAKAIIDMGQNMGFLVIAEGIEKKEQRDFLLANGCLIGQGYFYSRAVPEDVIQKMWAENEGRT
ncbi:histidine kinase [Bacillus coahuilensis p1.1.43]|uniref:Histidine kinase n=1 Tax=Bacillus coahuilensis p1.1.43 TaxID=1150625 RepID=A0A147K4P9_9BACI|nr:GGDEF and EAL domain-containing protein [Bacillus coahuilensis]KUP04409.1 histidine kinase [Bacillus coahuilensis p1.1.43]